jgi:molecular chaperone DnaK
MISGGGDMPLIGIDLGTSNSAGAVLRAGRPVIIPSAEGISVGGKAFPSYVAVTARGEILVGEPARRQAAANPEGTITGFKRRMGRRETLRLRDREFSPEQLSALLLQKIKRDAETFLGERVEGAVVTVPAYFDDNQRSATKDACGIAGLDVRRLINEPTAASLAYGLDRLGQELRIAVVDLGGGTLDVTVLEFGKGVFEVKATSGDTHLGGRDMDQLLVEHLAQRFREQTGGVDLHADIMALARLREAGEMAKLELSSQTSARVALPFLTTAGAKPHHMDEELTRSQLERIVAPVIERAREPVQRALRDAKVGINQIDRLVLVGGPTRMPCVRAFFESLLGRAAEGGVDPMECVASGAAIQAGVLAGEVSDLVLVDVTPLTLGVETLGGIATAQIARNTPIPVRSSQVFTTAADLQTAVTIHVFQGERPMAADNTSLGQFTLEGLPPAPRGIPKIEITFDIDKDGILEVSACDLATRKSQSIRVTGSTRLSQDEKQRMVADAQHYAEEDRVRRERAETLNAADATCHQAERLLAEHGSKLTADLRARIESALREAREAFETGDVDRARERSEPLQRVLEEAGTELYRQATPGHATPAGATPAGAAPGTAPHGQQVVDADYRRR